MKYLALLAILSLLGCDKSGPDPQKEIVYVSLKWETTDGKTGESNLIAVQPER